MSHRKQKLGLWNNNPKCHWCGEVTLLTNEKEIKGHPHPRMATLDHLISRYDPRRWLHAPPNEKRNVLACFKCNQERQAEETRKLSIEERTARSINAGLTFKPHKSLKAPVKSLDELKKLFADQGIDLDISNGPPKVVGVLCNI